MSCVVPNEAEAMVQLLVRGDLAELSEKYAFPAVVYVGRKIVPLTSKNKFLKALGAYRQILLDAGLAGIRTEVVDCRSTHDDQCSFCVENEYVSVSGASLGTAKINFFCERYKYETRIRMVEYLEWPCADQIATSEKIQEILL